MRFHKPRILTVTLALSLTLTALPQYLQNAPAHSANALVTDPAGDYDNFAKALQYSLYFYDANMCGNEVTANNRFAWRADCHTYDAAVPLHPIDSEHNGVNLSQSFIEQYYDILNTGETEGTVDVAGGFHDAGDHVKFGLPEAYAGTTLSWGYYEFRDAYVETEQAAHLETIIRYFCDYFMKCTFRDANGDVVAFCYQVGDGNIDHQYWQLPQNDAMARPAWFATPENPTTCNVANTAACLAINHLIWAEDDPDYAAKCLDYALALYDFATRNDKAIADTEQGPASFYTSSHWEDDYCFAACWLYRITGDHQYLADALPIVDYYAAPSYVYCWNDMWNGVDLLLAIISDTYRNGETYSEAENPKGHSDLAMEYITVNNKSPYEDIDFWYICSKALHSYMSGSPGTLSPQGYWWMDTWGSARYNTAGQMQAMIYDKYRTKADVYDVYNYKETGKDSENGLFAAWARGQMEYLLGDNEITALESEDQHTESRCFIVGYDENSVKYPHHRAASGLTKCEDTDPHLYVLFGALAGGPDADDAHNDITEDWIYNEVTIDYNAALPAAAAGLYLKYKDDYPQAITPDFPPVNDGGRASQGGEGGGASAGNKTWVESMATTITQTDGEKANEITFFVRTNVASPMKNVSVRYYFTLGNVTIDQMELRELYDQAATEAQQDGVLSGPHVYDAAKGIYYVEVTWEDYAICNSGKKYQFAIGSYHYGDSWDSTDDWSFENMHVVESNWDTDCIENDHICIYNDGVLVGGIEPDGTTVDDGKEDPPVGTLYGDVDCNGEIALSDAILLCRYNAEDTLAVVTAQGSTNADCDHDGMLSASDVTLILRYLAKLITSEDLGN